MALMKSQNDYKDKILNAKDFIINAKNYFINAWNSAIKVKDEEIDLLNKRIKEYENIKK